MIPTRQKHASRLQQCKGFRSEGCGGGRGEERTPVILELGCQTEVEGHVSGQDCADDQLPDLLQLTCNRVMASHNISCKLLCHEIISKMRCAKLETVR